MTQKSTEKLQKVLARAGLGSRREIEKWIATDKISVNGKPAVLGDRITRRDKIRVNGRLVQLQPITDIRVLMYYKPEGEMCTRSDPEGRPTVFDKLPPIKNARWIVVGRLDFNSMGLLLFTNDGELANKLMHPSQEFEREYAVRVFGKVDEAMLTRLKTGVLLEDGITSFKQIKEAGGEGANCWYHVVVTEGRNHLVRRLWESQGVKVSRLIRIRYGSVSLPPSLHAGMWKELDKKLVRYIT